MFSNLRLLEKIINELLREASSKIMVNLFYVHSMSEGCIMATNSGGVKRYVVGRLHSGNVFVEEALSE